MFCFLEFCCILLRVLFDLLIFVLSNWFNFCCFFCFPLSCFVLICFGISINSPVSGTCSRNKPCKYSIILGFISPFLLFSVMSDWELNISCTKSSASHDHLFSRTRCVTLSSVNIASELMPGNIFTFLANHWAVKKKSGSNKSVCSGLYWWLHTKKARVTEILSESVNIWHTVISINSSGAIWITWASEMLNFFLNNPLWYLL